MCFVATALWYERPAGLLISVYVYIVYLLALRFEGCVFPHFIPGHGKLTVRQTLDRYDLRQARRRAEGQVFVETICEAVRCSLYGGQWRLV